MSGTLLCLSIVVRCSCCSVSVHIKELLTKRCTCCHVGYIGWNEDHPGLVRAHRTTRKHIPSKEELRDITDELMHFLSNEARVQKFLYYLAQDHKVKASESSWQPFETIRHFRL